MENMKNKISTQIMRNKLSLLFLPFVGLAAILWFLVRVLPKPSRAAYPCQRVAAGVGGGFIAYLVGILGLLPFLHKFKYKLAKNRTAIFSVLSISLLLIGAVLASMYIPTAVDNFGFVPADPANQPIGEAKGYFPGRVAWVQDRQAALWDGVTGFWWDDANTDPAAVDNLLSRSLQIYAGEPVTADAWEAIFQHFNTVNGRGSVGYQPDEKIVIKINSNQDSGRAWDNGGYHSPQLVYSLVNQLINVVGAAGADITIADSSRYIGDPIYDRVRANPAQDFQDVKFVVKPALVKNGRIAAAPDYSKPIHFVKPYPTDPDICTHYPPLSYTQATYLVNLALLRSHSLFGVTLCAKNHFGSVFNEEEFKPQKLHGSGITANPPNRLGNPHCHPVLIGHDELGGKTLLYIIDSIYTAVYQGSKDIVKWQTLGNDWCAGLLVSQDPVAIDSVALDFLRSEPNMQVAALTVNTCNYLHEAALAHDPPSGAFYDPDNDGVRLQSLGTHEHWNNASDRMYSGNLGTGNGIELVKDVSEVSLLFPQGGEVWGRGTRKTITWQADKLRNNVSILLYKDGAPVGTIAADLNPASGAFTWKVGKLLGKIATVGTGYRIVVKERGYKYYDYNDPAMTFIDLRVKSPNGGESLVKGTTRRVTWRAAGFTDPLKISLWKDGTWIGVIAHEVDPALGSYSWKVGDYVGGSAAAGGGYKIMIKDTKSLVKDRSNSPFTITN